MITRKILVIGHQGFIGHAVYDRLFHLYGRHVIGWDNGETDFELWKEYWDVFASMYESFDYVIHLGSSSDSQHGFDFYRANIIEPTQVITDYANDIGAKMVYFSSCLAEYAMSSYGEAKLIAEKYVLDNLLDEACVFRPFAVWSLSEPYVKKNGHSIISKWLRGELEYIFEDCVRDFVHLLDVVDAVNRAVVEWRPGVFDIGTGVGTKVVDLPELLSGYRRDSDFLEADAEIVPTGLAHVDGYIRSLVADPTRMLPFWHPKPAHAMFGCHSLEPSAVPDGWQDELPNVEESW